MRRRPPLGRTCPRATHRRRGAGPRIACAGRACIGMQARASALCAWNPPAFRLIRRTASAAAASRRIAQHTATHESLTSAHSALFQSPFSVHSATASPNWSAHAHFSTSLPPYCFTPPCLHAQLPGLPPCIKHKPQPSAGQAAAHRAVRSRPHTLYDAARCCSAALQFFVPTACSTSRKECSAADHGEGRGQGAGWHVRELWMGADRAALQDNRRRRLIRYRLGYRAGQGARQAGRRSGPGGWPEPGRAWRALGRRFDATAAPHR